MKETLRPYRVHFAGPTAQIALDPNYVKNLGITRNTYFVEKLIDNGIMLERYELIPANKQMGKQTREQ